MFLNLYLISLVVYLCGLIFLKINLLNVSMLYVGIWYDDYFYFFDNLIRKKVVNFCLCGLVNFV